MAIISINYDEGNDKDLGYKSVEFSHHSKGEDKIFDSGDFIKDWYDMRKYMLTGAYDEYHYSQSSSVDHFIMDGAPFSSVYLHMVEEKPVLKYLDKSKPNYLDEQYDIYEKGTEFFVKENTEPTWEELRKLCGDEKK